MAIIVFNEPQVHEEFEIGNIEVILGGMVDIQSHRLTIYYKGVEVGDGTLNSVTNHAHIDLFKNCDLEDDIVNGIEERTINIR